MRLTKRIILWAYRSQFSLYSQAGVDHETDPDVFTAWLYLGFFGIAVAWSCDGWLYSHEATAERAISILTAADPQKPTSIFSDEWDRLDAQGS